MFIDEFSRCFTQIHRNMNFFNKLRDEFLSILENFFQSCRIFGGKSISAIKTVLEAITQPPDQIDEMFQS